MRSLPHITVGCASVYFGFRLLGLGHSGRAPGEEHRDLAAEGPQEGRGGAETTDIDYRWVAVGALLPDLVDKAVSRYLCKRAFAGNEHIFGHTLLLNLSLLLPGLAIARRGDPRPLAVAVAALTHLLTDPVMRAPRTLLWPVLGVRFPHVSGWGIRLTVASQGLAAVSLSVAAYRLWKSGRLPRFLHTGRL